MKTKIRKYLVRATIILPLLLGVLYLYYRAPKLVKLEYRGIYYQLGNPEMTEEVPVIFDGYLTRGLWLEDSFQGTVTIGDATLNKVDIRLPKDSPSVIVYYDDATKDYVTYGALYSKDIKKSFTIIVHQYDKATDSDRWSSADGYMISAPAQDRPEALELSNQLMKEYLSKELE